MGSYHSATYTAIAAANAMTAMRAPPIFSDDRWAYLRGIGLGRGDREGVREGEKRVDDGWLGILIGGCRGFRVITYYYTAGQHCTTIQPHTHQLRCFLSVAFTLRPAMPRFTGDFRAGPRILKEDPEDLWGDGVE